MHQIAFLTWSITTNPSIYQCPVGQVVARRGSVPTTHQSVMVARREALFTPATCSLFLSIFLLLRFFWWCDLRILLFSLICISFHFVFLFNFYFLWYIWVLQFTFSLSVCLSNLSLLLSVVWRQPRAVASSHTTISYLYYYYYYYV